MTKPLLLCTICARGGSKGVPGKNIRSMLGKPLIAYTIGQARDAGIFTSIAVSSDSDEILSVASAHGADMVIERPVELATDNSGKLPAILHALNEMEARLSLNADYHFDLDATSPLRIPDDILKCAAILQSSGCSNIITGTQAHRSPYFNLVERDTNGRVSLSKKLPVDVLRRQDSPECFDMNGSIYGWRRDVLREDPRLFYDDTSLYVMPKERSWDIDEEFDFQLVQLLMKDRVG